MTPQMCSLFMREPLDSTIAFPRSDICRLVAPFSDYWGPATRIYRPHLAVCFDSSRYVGKCQGMSIELRFYDPDFVPRFC